MYTRKNKQRDFNSLIIKLCNFVSTISTAYNQLRNLSIRYMQKFSIPQNRTFIFGMNTERREHLILRGICKVSFSIPGRSTNNRYYLNAEIILSVVCVNSDFSRTISNRHLLLIDLFSRNNTFEQKRSRGIDVCSCLYCCRLRNPRSFVSNLFCVIFSLRTLRQTARECGLGIFLEGLS